MRFFVILMALAISTSAYAQNRVYDGCIGQCQGVLNDDEYYQSGVGIKPNVTIRSQNMSVFNLMFARSEILYSERDSNDFFDFHRYSILLKGESKTELFYGNCELSFDKSYEYFRNGVCQLFEGEDRYGIAAMLKENFSDE